MIINTLDPQLKEQAQKRLADFSAAYQIRLVPTLKKHGLSESAQQER